MSAVSPADLLRDFEHYRAVAQHEPVTITDRGKDSVVLISSSEYARLKSRDRQALLIEELDPDTIEALAKAEVPPGHEHLDRLLDGWTP